MTNQEYINDFERYLLTEKRVAKNTFDAYRRDLIQLIDYMEQASLACATITLQELQAFLVYLRKKNITARSIARKISCTKTFFSFLKQYHGLENHAQSLHTPTLEKRLPTYLKEQEVERLLETAHLDTSIHGVRNATMLYLLYATGLRISELVSLNVNALDFSQGYITVHGKGNKERIVPLPEHLMQFIEYYLEEIYPQLLIKDGEHCTTHFLFPTFYAGVLKAMSRQMFWVYLKKIARRAGITNTLSPHMLRHSLATHLLKKGAHLRSLQLLLGHEQLTTVQIYTHVETEHLRKIYDKKHPRS